MQKKAKFFFKFAKYICKKKKQKIIFQKKMQQKSGGVCILPWAYAENLLKFNEMAYFQ